MQGCGTLGNEELVLYRLATTDEFIHPPAFGPLIVGIIQAEVL